MGSLGSDLSPLGTLYFSTGQQPQVQNCFHSIVAVLTGGALLTKRWYLSNRYAKEIQRNWCFQVHPCAKVFSSLSVLLWLSVTGCTVPPWPCPCPSECAAVCLCSVARRLSEFQTVSLLPLWQGAWAGEASSLGTRRVQGPHRNHWNVLWGW